MKFASVANVVVDDQGRKKEGLKGVFPEGARGVVGRSSLMVFDLFGM